jgi:diguanylate cyclase (GGDEF)-like protein
MEAPNEATRLAELHSLALLDSTSEERFDRITRLAQRLFDVQISLVSLVDLDRLWFKSHQGLDMTETPREDSFCSYTILGDDVLVVSDASDDARFSNNPLVHGDSRIRFYAGSPIAGPSGAKLGTLCIMSRAPRELSEADSASLRDLAEMVEREIAAQHITVNDELTGLSNRRGFELSASIVVDVCRRRATAASLLYIDIDGFRTINERFSQSEGDRALREFAEILEKTFRRSDIIARLGKDQFAIFLFRAPDPSGAIDRLQGALEDRNDATKSDYSLSATIGVGSFDPESDDTIEDLLSRAESLMSTGKRQKSSEQS